MGDESARSMGFHHVAIKAHAWDASMRFYQDVLGFTVRLSWGDPPRRAVYLEAAHGGSVEVFEDVEFVPHPTGTLEPGGAILHLCLQTDDVDAAHARAVAAGARTVSEPWDLTLETTTGHGPVHVRLCFFEGPSGELIELIRWPSRSWRAARAAAVDS